MRSTRVTGFHPVFVMDAETEGQMARLGGQMGTLANRISPARLEKLDLEDGLFGS